MARDPRRGDRRDADAAFKRRERKEAGEAAVPYRRVAPPPDGRGGADDEPEPLYGGVEAGGTKFKCVIGTGPDDIRARIRVATEDPRSTLAAVVDFFAGMRTEGLPVTAVGVGAFGPVDLDPRSRSYGRITRTPKAGWSGTDVAGALARGVRVPVAIDTDVAAAALAEHRWGAAVGLESFVYLTVGTGIGGAALVGGRPLRGEGHPEMGHFRVPVAPGDRFDGVCPYHGGCWEGMASGPALAARFGRRAEDLGGEALARAVELEGGYLAAGLATIALVLAPQRILLGGGASLLPGLMDAVREGFALLMADYPDVAAHQDPTFIRAPALGGAAGALGGLVLAEQAAAARP